MPEIAVLVGLMLLAGILAGVLAGMLGVGGGIVIVPAVDLVLQWYGVPPDFRMHMAVATSLAVIIPTSMSSARAHYRRGAVDLDLAKRWMPFIALGAVLGVGVASRVSGPTLAVIFAVFVTLVALKLLLPGDAKAVTRQVPGGAITVMVPTAIGTISSMMGIGGGTLTVPALTLMGESIHRAVGTSALFGLLIALPGTLAFVAAGWGYEQLPPASLGFVNLLGMLVIAPATVLAAPLGARIAHALSQRTLRLFFGLFLMLVAVRMLWHALGGR